jgi:RNA polymerase sigma-B factor
MDLSRDRQNGTDGGERHASDEELIRLVQTLPHGDARRDRACETLMARYGHIVRSAVQRHRAARDLAEDLTQVGYLGLMKAITNFDPAVGSSLAAYAQPCVTGEIKRHFRDKRWQGRVARPAQELRLELRRATDDLAQQLARTPSDTELASHLHITQGEVVTARLAARAFTATSLDAPVSSEDGAASIGELIGDEDPGLEHTLNMEALRTHWEELAEPDRQLLLMRFYGNMTQSEIGQQLGVSQMQVSRLLRRTLDYLRQRLTDPERGQVA